MSAEKSKLALKTKKERLAFPLRLVREVRKMVRERPDVYYVTPRWVVSDATDIRCFYDERGRCSDGSVGCAFGQAFVRLFGGLEKFDKQFNNCISVSRRVREIILDDVIAEGSEDPRILEVAQWCDVFQANQDSGIVWHTCLERADSTTGYIEGTGK